MVRFWLAPSSRPPIESVKNRLGALAPLTTQAEALLGQLTGRRTFPMGADLLCDVGEPLRFAFITTGWAARAGLLPDGRRQILSLLLPGDPIFLRSPSSTGLESQIMALTPVELVEAEAISAAAFSGEAQWRCLQDALRISQRLHETYLLNQILRLGRLKAYERLCHLLLEVHGRLELAGLSQDGSFQMPLTQEVLADAAGLSTVHVNRTLQILRRNKSLQLRSGKAMLLDREGMAAACDYHGTDTERLSALRVAGEVRPDRHQPDLLTL